MEPLFRLRMRSILCCLVLSFAAFPQILSAQAQDVVSESCTFNGEDYFLRLSLAEDHETTAYGNCTVVPIAVSVSYPVNDNSTFEMCIVLPLQPNGQSPHFIINDAGDFTFSGPVGLNESRYCQTVSVAEDGDLELGTITKFMYVKPFGVVADNNTKPARLLATLSRTGNLGLCTTERAAISLGSADINDLSSLNPVINIPNGANLSSLYDDGSLLQFQSPANAPSRPISIVLNGDLIVDEDYDLGSQNTSNFRSELVLTPGSSITVADNVSLNLQRIDIRGCDAMWGGIIVEDEGELTIRDATIQDGEAAVLVKGQGKAEIRQSNFDNNYVGVLVNGNGNGRRGSMANVRVLGTRFGFQYRSFSTPNQPTSGDPSLGERLNDPPPRLLAPHFGEAPLAGSFTRNVSTASLFMAEPSTNRRNYFNRLQRGIIFERSSGTVHDSDFFDIGPEEFTAVNGIGILITEGTSSRRSSSRSIRITPRVSSDPTTNVTFERMHTGVQNDARHRIRIQSTLMTDLNIGVESVNDWNLRIRDNDITAYQFGIKKSHNGPSFPPSRLRVDDNLIRIESNSFNLPTSAGIEIAAVNNGFPQVVEDNVITLNGGIYGIHGIDNRLIEYEDNEVFFEGSSQFKRGIALEGSLAPTVRNNLFQGSVGADFTESWGMLFNGVRDALISCNTSDEVEIGALFFDQCPQTDFRGNALFESLTGLQVGLQLIDSDPTFIGRQEHRGNHFYGPYSAPNGAGALYFGALNIISFSQFNVESAPTTLRPTTNVNTPGNWFKVESASPGETYICPANQPPAPKFNLFSPRSASLINGTFDTTTAWIATRWDAETHLVQGINAGYISSADYPNLPNYLGSPSNLLVNSFMGVSEDLANIYGITRAEATDLNNYRTNIDLKDSVRTSLIVKSYFAPANFSANDQAELLAAEADLSAGLISLVALDSTVKERGPTNVSLVQQDNIALPAPILPQQLEKNLNGMQLAILQDTSDSWHNYAATIRAIAETCPLDGGAAVYRARAIAASNNIAYVVGSDQGCQNLARPAITEETIVKETLLLYPNPASDLVKINLANIESDQAVDRVVIYSIDGRLIQSANEFADASKSNELVLDISSLRPQTYVVRLHLSDGSSLSVKLIKE